MLMDTRNAAAPLRLHTGTRRIRRSAATTCTIAIPAHSSAIRASSHATHQLSSLGPGYSQTILHANVCRHSASPSITASLCVLDRLTRNRDSSKDREKSDSKFAGLSREGIGYSRRTSKDYKEL